MRNNEQPFIQLLEHPVLQKFELNKKGKDYFVGDIHGSFDRLKKALKAISFDKTKDRLFCCGDLVDRGNSHRGILDFINQDWFYCCLGNHDNMLLNVLENHDDIGFEKSDVVEVPIRKFSEEKGVYETVGVNKIPYEEYYKAGIAHGDHKFLNDFSYDEIMKVRKYMESLPLMMKVKTENGDIGIVHAEIPAGKTFDWTVDWIKNKNWQEASVAREYLFWGERGRYLPYEVNMMFMSIFDFCKNQEDVNKIVDKTAQDLYLLYMGHNIMPVEFKPFHQEDIKKRIDFNTKHLKFIDHGAFVADQIETNAYGLGIYDTNGEMILFLDSDPI